MTITSCFGRVVHLSEWTRAIVQYRKEFKTFSSAYFVILETYPFSDIEDQASCNLVLIDKFTDESEAKNRALKINELIVRVKNEYSQK